jgi:hypothetical protein
MSPYDKAPFLGLHRWKQCLTLAGDIGENMPIAYQRHVFTLLVDAMLEVAMPMLKDENFRDLLVPLKIALESLGDSQDLLREFPDHHVIRDIRDFLGMSDDVSGVLDKGLRGPNPIPEVHTNTSSPVGGNDLDGHQSTGEETPTPEYYECGPDCKCGGYRG